MMDRAELRLHVFVIDRWAELHGQETLTAAAARIVGGVLPDLRRVMAELRLTSMEADYFGQFSGEDLYAE